MKTIEKTVVLIGAGRTGSRAATTLAKEGWKLTIIDRDAIEPADTIDSPTYAAKDEGQLKAPTLAKKLNSNRVNAIADHLMGQNASQYLEGATILLDATDNWNTRALLNEYAWKTRTPLVYCGALKDKAMASTITPPQKPCWLCWNANEPEETLSCLQHGLTPEAADEAAKILCSEATLLANGKTPKLAGKLFYYNSTTNTSAAIKLKPNSDCPVCAKNEFTQLNQKRENALLVCGTGQWQFLNSELRQKVRHYAPETLAKKLSGMHARPLGSIVKAKILSSEATILPGGRTLIRAKNESEAEKANHAIAQKLAQ